MRRWVRISSGVFVTTLVAAGVIAYTSTIGGAATLFVSTTGSGSACSQIAPCASFDTAYQTASCGATIEIAGGTYGAQNIGAAGSKSCGSGCFLARDGSGSTAGCITFQPAPSAVVRVTGLGAYAESLRICGSYVRVIGITVAPPTFTDGSGNSVSRVGLYSGSGDNYCTPNPQPHDQILDHITATGSAIHVRGSYNVDVQNSTSDSVYNEVSFTSNGNNGSWPIHDVIWQDDSFTNYLATDLVTYHMECLHLDGAADTFTIRRTTFRNCAVFDIFVEARGGVQTGHLIENNFLYHPCDAGTGCPGTGTSALAIANQIDNGTVSNITVRYNSADGAAGATSPGIRWTNGCSTGCTNSGNLAYGNIAYGDCSNAAPGWTKSYNLWTGTTCSGTGEVGSATPGYTSLTDLHLSGTPTACSFVPGGQARPIDDIDKDARSVSGTTEAGADEKASC